jgi:hypothetical protein
MEECSLFVGNTPAKEGVVVAIFAGRAIVTAANDSARTRWANGVHPLARGDDTLHASLGSVPVRVVSNPLHTK